MKPTAVVLTTSIPLIVAVLAPADDAIRERPAPGFAIHARHYEAVKDLLGSRDTLFAFCTRDPAIGDDGRATRAQPPVWNEAKSKDRLSELNTVKGSRATKAVVFSAVEDLEKMLDRLPQDVSWVIYNSEPGMTPMQELTNHEASVKRFAQIAHGRGLKVGWGPTLMQLERLADAPLANAKFVDRVGLQHQRLLQFQGLEAFARETRRRAALIRKHNPKCAVSVQVVIGRSSVEQCLGALRAVKGDVDGMSAWTMNDTDALRRIISELRGAASAPAGPRVGGTPFGPFHLMPERFGAPFSLVMAGTSTTRYLDEVFPNVSVTPNLAFCRGSTLLLDLYQPAGDAATTRPAIVWIHGGGFYKGAKSDPNMVTLAERFAKRGYVTASINYRLAPKDEVDPNLPTFSKAAFAQAVTSATKDARAAVRWLRANATRFRIDKQRIAIGGGSAGAFTSLHVAYTNDEEEGSKPDDSSEVCAVVDIWGGLLNANEMKAGGPPLLIIHGTLDKLVPVAFAEKLVSRAKEVGVTCEFHPLEGKGHAAWASMEQYIRWIAPFLYHHVIETKK